MQEILQKFSFEKKLCGHFNEQDIYSFTINNSSVEITFINLGCTIISIKTLDKIGAIKNIVAGFKTVEEYTNNKDFFGCVVGRYANRISNGTFSIDSKIYHTTVNDGVNTLHGGINGFHKKVWNIKKTILTKTKSGVEFEYISHEGEEGFPGKLITSVTYTLNDKNELIIQYKATTDKATPVNLTNHSYFNLTGFDEINMGDHCLWINANAYTIKNTSNQLTGKTVAVNKTVFDFRSPKKIKTDLWDALLKEDRGYDHNYVLKTENSDQLIHAARLTEQTSGRMLNVYTTAPGMQLYTANFWDGSVIGAQNKTYQQHSAVALETQSFPDSPNHSNFPNTIIYPGEEYNSITIYAFSLINQ